MQWCPGSLPRTGAGLRRCCGLTRSRVPVEATHAFRTGWHDCTSGAAGAFGGQLTASTAWITSSLLPPPARGANVDASARASCWQYGDSMIISTTSSPTPTPGGIVARRVDEILAAVVFGAQDFLNHDDWEQVLDAWLERLGRATDSHRVRVFRNRESRQDGGLRAGMIADWQAPDVVALTDARLADIGYSQCGCDRWPGVLSQGGRIVGSAEEFADCERDFLRMQGIESVAIVPVFVRNEWWGFMAFGDCAAPREWSEPVLQALSAAAGILGAALARIEMEHRISASLAREQLAAEIGTLLTDQPRSLVESLHRCARTLVKHLH